MQRSAPARARARASQRQPASPSAAEALLALQNLHSTLCVPGQQRCSLLSALLGRRSRQQAVGGWQQGRGGALGLKHSHSKQARQRHPGANWAGVLQVPAPKFRRCRLSNAEPFAPNRPATRARPAAPRRNSLSTHPPSLCLPVCLPACPRSVSDWATARTRVSPRNAAPARLLLLVLLASRAINCTVASPWNGRNALQPSTDGGSTRYLGRGPRWICP